MRKVRVLGIVGSPHADGWTSGLVSSALDGAASVGADIETVSLAKYRIIQCVEDRSECWSDGICRRSQVATMLSRKLDESDAIVLGAPVYQHDVNGLTKDFMDTTRTLDTNGKPALGITLAGGTGKGLTSALKSIYNFFFGRELRGIDPLPVSRFNYQKALSEAYASGQNLAEMLTSRRPFRDLSERIAYYYSLKYMDYDIVDENLLLAQQLIENLAPFEQVKPLFEEARREYSTAEKLVTQGRKTEAIVYIVNSYEAGAKAWARLEEENVQRPIRRKLEEILYHEKHYKESTPIGLWPNDALG